MRAALEARAHPTWSRSLSDPGCKCAPGSVDLSRRLPPFFSATAIFCAARALADGCSHATLVPFVCSSRDAGSDIGVGPSRRCPHTFQPGRDCASPTCSVLRPTPHHHPPPRECAARPPLEGVFCRFLLPLPSPRASLYRCVRRPQIDACCDKWGSPLPDDTHQSVTSGWPVRGNRRGVKVVRSNGLAGGPSGVRDEREKGGGRSCGSDAVGRGSVRRHDG